MSANLDDDRSTGYIAHCNCNCSVLANNNINIRNSNAFNCSIVFDDVKLFGCAVSIVFIIFSNCSGYNVVSCRQFCSVYIDFAVNNSIFFTVDCYNSSSIVCNCDWEVRFNLIYCTNINGYSGVMLDNCECCEVSRSSVVIVFSNFSGYSVVACNGSIESVFVICTFNNFNAVHFND